jgi:MYXO-CTERM domain-containing protein
VGVAALLAVALVPTDSQAHFYLQSPPANFEQSALGDPQKEPPCGDDGTATPTGMVTTFQAGETISITFEETIFHPGHFRVAVAVNDPSELPADPPVEQVGMDECGMTTIDPAPVFPVLVDGALAHTDPLAGPQTIEVTLPDDLSCTACTLQIIQYMSSHGAPCFYHHCATIAVEGAAGETMSTTVDPTSGGSSGDGESSASDSAGSSTTEPDDETTDTPGETSNGSADSSGTGVVTTVTPEAEPPDEGCGCRQGGAGGRLGAMLLLGIAGLGARRRRWG